MARNFRSQPDPPRGAYFVLWRNAERLGDKPTRWRIVITRKLTALATQRNRWRRRVKEILRKHREEILPGYEASLKLCKKEPPLTATELERQILELIDKSGLRKR